MGCSNEGMRERYRSAKRHIQDSIHNPSLGHFRTREILLPHYLILVNLPKDSHGLSQATSNCNTHLQLYSTDQVTLTNITRAIDKQIRYSKHSIS